VTPSTQQPTRPPRPASLRTWTRLAAPVTEIGSDLATTTCRFCRTQLGLDADADASRRLEGLFVLSTTLGLRPGELANLRGTTSTWTTESSTCGAQRGRRGSRPATLRMACRPTRCDRTSVLARLGEPSWSSVRTYRTAAPRAFSPTSLLTQRDVGRETDISDSRSLLRRGGLGRGGRLCRGVLGHRRLPGAGHAGDPGLAPVSGPDPGPARLRHLDRPRLVPAAGPLRRDRRSASPSG
jgi:hypothetical protein